MMTWCCVHRRHLPNSWVELESPDGEIYYANVKTKETSWDQPDCDLEDKENQHENVLMPISKIAAVAQAPRSTSPASKAGGKGLDVSQVSLSVDWSTVSGCSADSRGSQGSRTFPRFSQCPLQGKQQEMTCEESMSVSFVAKESHAVSDLAALADMSVAHLSPREVQPDAGVGILLEQLEEGGPIAVGKIFKEGPAALR